jgi:capsular polysaccharide biosynthesis protein
MFGYSKKLVIQGERFKRTLPSNITGENIKSFVVNSKYKCPDLFLYLFRKVFFLPDSTLFLFRIWPLANSFPFFKKRIRHHSIKGIFDIQRTWNYQLLPKAEKPYLIIHDAWTLNYYHWMTQALPRLLMASKSQLPFTLLLPKDHCLPFHIASLKMLGISNWITFDIGKKYYEVHDLIYPSRDIQIGDYHDGLINDLAYILRKGIEALRNKKTFLFIHRKSTAARRILNEDQVLSAVLSHGFKVVYFENLSLEEQKLLAGKASILAGVHGAGLTNMLFMEKGGRVFELTTVTNGEQYYYYTLSNALGHHYYYQFCQPEAEGKSIQEANLFVDVGLLNRNLDLLIKNNDG